MDPMMAGLFGMGDGAGASDPMAPRRSWMMQRILAKKKDGAGNDFGGMADALVMAYLRDPKGFERGISQFGQGLHNWGQGLDWKGNMPYEALQAGVAKGWGMPG